MSYYDYEGPVEPPEPDWDEYRKCPDCCKYVSLKEVPYNGSLDEDGNVIMMMEKQPCKWCEARRQGLEV